MTCLLVMNHGSNTDNHDRDYWIAKLTRQGASEPDVTTPVWHNMAPMVLTYPGFGSAEYKKLWASRAGGSQISGALSALVAKSQYKTVANWLLEDIGSLGRTPKEMSNITFIGHSRGCFTMFYQIAALRKKGFEGRVQLLQFDPCYGPKSFAFDEDVIRGRGDSRMIGWQVLMMHGSTALGYLPAYPLPREKAKRTYYVPGCHGSAMNNADSDWPESCKLGEDIITRFLMEACPMRFRLRTSTLIDEAKCAAYARMKNLNQSTHYSFSQRDSVRACYDADKVSGARTWARLEQMRGQKIGFFYNEDEFAAFRRCWPNLATTLYGLPVIPASVAEYQELNASYPMIGVSIRLWGLNAKFPLPGISRH
jgi:hypothetical protein